MYDTQINTEFCICFEYKPKIFRNGETENKQIGIFSYSNHKLSVLTFTTSTNKLCCYNILD